MNTVTQVRVLTAHQTERLRAFIKFHKDYFDRDPVFNADTSEYEAPIRPCSFYPVQPLDGFDFDGAPDHGLEVADRLPVAVVVGTTILMGEAVAFNRGSTPMRWATEDLSLSLNDPKDPLAQALPGPPIQGRPCISRNGAQARIFYEEDSHGIAMIAFQVRVRAARILIPKNTWKARPWMLKQAERWRDERVATCAAVWAAVAAATLEETP